MIRERTRDDVRNIGGLLSPQIPCGGWVTCTTVGGFEDVTTGLKAPGPKAVIDDLTREIVALCDLPDPVQMFTHKRVRNAKDMSEIIEVAFDAHDEAGTCDGIQRALDVGILQIVPDEDVERYFPSAWRKRRDKYVFDWRERTKPQAALVDMLEQARAAQRNDLDAARERNAEAHAAAKSAAK